MPLSKKMSTLIFALVLLIHPMTAQALDILGGKAPAITSNKINPASIAAFKKRCEEAHLLTIPNRGRCDEIVRDARLSQSSFDFCFNKYAKDSLAPFIECVQRADGRDYPNSYLDACNGARSETGGLKICPEYLAQTEAGFDMEAFRFCLFTSQNKFEYAKPCLNAIRDRQVDVQKLKKTCVDEISFGEKFINCVYRVTDKAPSAANCSAPSASRPTTPAHNGIQ